MNGFNAQTGEGIYRLQFETDNKSNFESMQALARMCVDGKEPVIRYSGEDEKTLIRWVSVEERPPKHTSDYLVYVHVAYPDGIYGFEMRTAYYNTVTKKWLVLKLRNYEAVSNPTHWAEMPEPPKE